MLKITLQIQESKEKDKCTVTVINPKDLSKATENEKRVGAMVRNNVEKTLKEMVD